MEQYIVHLFYLSVVLVFGILITGITRQLKLSSVLFLVLIGYVLDLFGLDFFTQEFTLVISALALIVMVIETTMSVSIVHVLRNFLHVLKFSLVYFLLCLYALSLALFQILDISGQQFEIFVLCLVLSIIMYGVDPSIVMEFFDQEKSTIRDTLRIEGLVSGPVVVIFSFFLIDYLSSLSGDFSQSLLQQGSAIIQQLVISVGVGAVLAFLVAKNMKHFKMTTELTSLFVIAVGIVVFVINELFHANGSLGVALYGLFLQPMIKEYVVKKYSTTIAHILYIIVFILLGTEFVFPDGKLWLIGIGVFIFSLLLRFFCVFLCYKQFTRKEQMFITLNTSKGIEVALVLFLLKLNFSHVTGIEVILSLGFSFFILGYIVSTVVNRFSTYFLSTKKRKLSA